MRISRAKLQRFIREEVGKLAERKPAEDKRGPEEEEALEETEELEENEDPLEEGGLGDDLDEPDYYHSSDRPQDVGGRSNLGGRYRGDSYRDRYKHDDDRKDYGPYEEGLNKKLTKEAVKNLVRQMIKEKNR